MARKLVNTLSKSYIELELGEFIEREAPKLGIHDRFGIINCAFEMFNTFPDKLRNTEGAQAFMDFVLAQAKALLKEARSEYFIKEEAQIKVKTTNKATILKRRTT